MLVRLVLLVLVIFGLVAVVRRFLGAKQVDGRLSASKLREIERNLGRHKQIQEGLRLRRQIADTLKSEPDAAKGGPTVHAQVDEVIQQLAAQLTVRDRVEKALKEIDLQKLAQDFLDAEAKLETATEASAKDALRRTLDRLETQSGHVERLKNRSELLETTSKQIVVELRNVHLALLDAMSSKAGMGSESIQTARKNLEEMSQTLRREADAEEEIQRLLTSSIEEQTPEDSSKSS